MLTCLLASLGTKTNSCTILVPDTYMNIKWKQVCKYRKTDVKQMDEYKKFKFVNKP